MSTFKNIYNEIDNCTKMFLFEIEVYNELTQGDDFVIYEINVNRLKNTFGTQSIDSDYIRMNIDPDFNLDSNLESFYELCINDIIESDDYNLRG